MLGSLISLMIWVILEGAQVIDFGMHLNRPEILYLALGTFASIIAGELMAKRNNGSPSDSHEIVDDEPDESNDADSKQGLDDEKKQQDTWTGKGLQIRKVIHLSVTDLRNEIREMVNNPREYLRSRRGILPPWIAIFSVSLFVIIGIIFFWFFTPFTGLRINWLLFVLGGPMVLVSAYFTARAICETGMLAGYLSDMLAIPAIIFFRVSFAALIGTHTKTASTSPIISSGLVSLVRPVTTTS